MICLPEDFTNRIKRQPGVDFEEFIRSYEHPALKAFRFNRRKVLPVDYARLCSVITGSDDPDPVKWWDGAFYYENDGPGSSPLHEAGVFYIQEPSAMLPVTLLDVDDSGLKVLDLCAAPGGKSTQIADLMMGSGLLVSNEVVQKRALILSENIERMGITNALVISADPDMLSERFPGYFDRILVDAPCSGEGMFRKNPEAVKEWSLDNVKMCAERQEMLLDRAVSMLSEGGRIVYSTCTFSPEEDERVTEHFLAAHPEFTVCDGPLKVYPHTVRGEGHYAVAFSDATGHVKDTPSKTRSRDLPEGRELHFGDSVYRAPQIMPDIDGLKVYRAGLKLGTQKKNRFEPDHALSHALTADEAELFVDLEPDSPEIRQYLSGMTLNCDKDMKGWCLVCTMGYPLGWAKAADGVLKNHYPRGLRR